MTVYSINQRIFEQTNQSTSNGKSASSTADEFLAALNKAGSQTSVSVNATPSAEKALSKVFERKNDEPRASTKSDDKPKRSEAKENTRSNKAEAANDAKASDDAKAKPTEKTDSVASADDRDADPQAKPEAKTETVSDDSQPQVKTENAAAPTAEAVAAVVPVQQQMIEQVATVAETTPAQVVESVDPEKIADAGDQPQQAQANPQNNAADANADNVETFDPTAQNTPQAAAKGKAGEHADKNAAATQAADLAASIDDTGAQLNVQVKVADTTRQVQPSVGTAEVLLTQDVDGLEIPVPAQGNGGQSNGQPQANAGQTNQAAGANQTQDPALMNKPVDAKPFVAALAAAQAEGASQPQAAGSSGNQTQAVAGLNGASGTQAAAKTAPAQAAQAPRQPQTPQAKEVMDQVKVQIAKQGANGDTIKVQLKPVELGSIEVKLDVAKDGSVSGVVTADNKDTLAMLKNDSRALEKALSDAGLKADTGSLTFNLRGENQQQAAQDQASGRRSRRALAAMNGVDATQSGAAAQAQARFAGGRSGVDIQV
ncbi:flagellar hook-length control protein FliK [Magnetospirillum sulfuroxidans]|uniref:Flagellar hook-length control protein FliK n=1 Tax=Magnetospirillum sulfuroxidans TaxID=611300 RepID=A0ABS5IFD6_9PROT|nr:flagellar hook-length control protein FliK [Magnetospirillum sulfuroxidans]MBR9973131.1 flagellar hook-length control protein FliK [Magnetospirillum sulfuroxidans]